MGGRVKPGNRNDFKLIPPTLPPHPASICEKINAKPASAWSKRRNPERTISLCSFFFLKSITESEGKHAVMYAGKERGAELIECLSQRISEGKGRKRRCRGSASKPTEHRHQQGSGGHRTRAPAGHSPSSDDNFGGFNEWQLGRGAGGTSRLKTWHPTGARSQPELLGQGPGRPRGRVPARLGSPWAHQPGRTFPYSPLFAVKMADL